MIRPFPLMPIHIPTCRATLDLAGSVGRRDRLIRPRSALSHKRDSVGHAHHRAVHPLVLRDLRVEPAHRLRGVIVAAQDPSAEEHVVEDHHPAGTQ